VTLNSNGRLQYLADFNIENTFRSLIVENNGIVDFNHREGSSQNSEYYIKVDDLIIDQDGHLEIHDWKVGRDYLLVRKDSKHLEDALNKISIEGWDQNQVYLKDYDEEYWSIEAAPEPSTYGAILGTVGIGLVVWRKRRKTQGQRRCAPNGRIDTPQWQ